MIAPLMCRVVDAISRRRMVFEAARAVGVSLVDRQYSSGGPESYEEAIKALNTLQTNASVIKQTISRAQHNAPGKLKTVEQYLARSGLSLDQLDALSVIHVAGTKGKGTTCAITESILKAHGFRTGFFSSPHLISVTERFRICAKPISNCVFSHYFWKVFTLLNAEKESHDDMPGYFMFLTILAFHIFLAERVDVAILEVGIGGEHDSTNVVRNTKTVGITSLALDHVDLLGDTLEEIAWQKAGIMKSECRAFTIAQPIQCAGVLASRAADKNARLCMAPDFTTLAWDQMPMLSIDSDAHRVNTSLAVALAHDWMEHNRHHYFQNLANTALTRRGIEESFWPGRCQLVQYQNINYYLDGAHTTESIQICIDWFRKTAANDRKKFLLFNMTGSRDVKKILKQLGDQIDFAEVLFVPNISSNNAKTNDIVSALTTRSEKCGKCVENANTWIELYGTGGTAPKANYFVSVLDGLKYLANEKYDSFDILVTGSLHLIGAVLLAIEEIK